MNRRHYFFLFLLIAGASAGCKKKSSSTCDTGKHYNYNPDIPAYWTLFNSTSGWVGGDAAYSIALTADKTLWIYGDTWHGNICDNKRKDATLSAHNTIAIQDGKNPSTAVLRYYFGSNNGSFFTPSDNVGALWTLHGTMVGGTLYLFMMQVVNSTSNTLGFQLTSSRLIKVANPLAPPAEWQISQTVIPHASFNSSADILFGAYVIQQNGYVYIFGTHTDFTTSERSVLLARTVPDSVAEFGSWRFYNAGQWVTDFNQAQHITSGVGTEFSVSYQPKTHKYVLITTEAGLSEKINMRTSDSLWTGWSAPVTVYRCPEVNWGSKDVFCYAAKGHPELSVDDELIITYASNSFSLSDDINNAELYWPRFIRIGF